MPPDQSIGMTREKKKGDRIPPGDLDLLTTLPRISGDSSIMIMPLKSKELPVLEMIDAGSHVYLISSMAADSSNQINNSGWQSKEGLPVSIKVIAIHRETVAASENWIWVEFPVAAHQHIADFIASDKRVITKAA